MENTLPERKYTDYIPEGVVNTNKTDAGFVDFIPAKTIDDVLGKQEVEEKPKKGTNGTTKSSRKTTKTI